MYRKRGRFETNYQIDLFCAVCVFILLHFVLHEKITFRFVRMLHFVLLDLVLIDLFCIAYTLEKLAKAFSEKRSFFSLLPTIIAILFAIALNFAIQYNILFDYEKEAFMKIQPECWYKDLANFFFYSFGVLTSSIITQIAAVSILAKVLVTLEVLSAFIFIILIIGNYKAIGESLSICDFCTEKTTKKSSNILQRKNNDRENTMPQSITC